MKDVDLAREICRSCLDKRFEEKGWNGKPQSFLARSSDIVDFINNYDFDYKNHMVNIEMTDGSDIYCWFSQCKFKFELELLSQ